MLVRKKRARKKAPWRMRGGKMPLGKKHRFHRGWRKKMPPGKKKLPGKREPTRKILPERTKIDPKKTIEMAVKKTTNLPVERNYLRKKRKQEK